MARKQLLTTIGLVFVVFAGAYFFTRGRQRPLGEHVDRGDRHEVAGQGRVLESKVDEQGAVTVKVQPQEFSPSVSQWEFEITLDTHSVELDDDMVEQSVLIDSQGNEHRPISWEGDPPGGHHRKGILKFQSLTSSNMIQLRMRGVGGVDERIFQWGAR